MIADLLPARVRAVVYAVLTAANGGYIAAEAIYVLPRWVLIVVGVVNASGFQLARTNTNKETP